MQWEITEIFPTQAWNRRKLNTHQRKRLSKKRMKMAETVNGAVGLKEVCQIFCLREQWPWENSGQKWQKLKNEKESFILTFWRGLEQVSVMTQSCLTFVVLSLNVKLLCPLSFSAVPTVQYLFSPTEKSDCSEQWFLHRKQLTPTANLVWVEVLLLSTGANCNHRLLPFPKH